MRLSAGPPQAPHNPHHVIRGVSVASRVTGSPLGVEHVRAHRIALAMRPRPGVRRPDPYKLHARIAHKYGAAALPASVDLSCGKVTDQGQSSSCTAHALAKGAEIAASGFLASEHALYRLTGELENDYGDDGRQLIDCLTIARTRGLAPFGGPSPDGRNSDVWTAQDTSLRPPNVTLACSPAELAALHPLDFGQTSIDPTAADLEQEACAALAAGHPLYVGGQVGSAFEALSGAMVAVPDPANDPTGGGHAMLVAGYRTMPDGSRPFRVYSSWGESWDDAGECWASLAWLASMWEIHPLVLA